MVTRLADHYPESTHVYYIQKDQVSDEELRDYARREDFVIVTKDSDFSDLCILLGFPPKVIWIRRGNCSTNTIESILREHHAEIEALNRDEIIGILTLF